MKKNIIFFKGLIVNIFVLSGILSGSEISFIIENETDKKVFFNRLQDNYTVVFGKFGFERDYLDPNNLTEEEKSSGLDYNVTRSFRIATMTEKFIDYNSLLSGKEEDLYKIRDYLSFSIDSGDSISKDEIVIYWGLYEPEVFVNSFKYVAVKEKKSSGEFVFKIKLQSSN